MNIRQKSKGKLCGLVISVLIFLASSGISFAETVVVFGPKKYIKPQGNSATYNDTFRIPEDVINCSLWVKNRSSDKEVVKDFSLYVNGIEVIDSSNLKGKNSPKMVNIKDRQNIIKVLLRGQDSGHLTLEVVGEKKVQDVKFVPPPRPVF